MIITCPNCNKQFKIDNFLIPDEGRNLQCGSCNHVWFYKEEDENEAILKLNENISVVFEADYNGQIGRWEVFGDPLLNNFSIVAMDVMLSKCL